MHKQQSVDSCLNFQIADAKGTQKFLDIVNSEQFDLKNHFVPAKWPDVSDKQKGPCCSMYSAVSLGKFSELCEAPVPPARKADIVTKNLKAEAEEKAGEKVESLREYAKKNGLTGFGALFNREFFKNFGNRLKMQEAEVLTMPTTPEMEKERIGR